MLPYGAELLDGAATSAVDSAEGYIELVYLGQDTLNTKKVKVNVTVNAAAIGILMQKHLSNSNKIEDRYNLVFNIRGLEGKTIGNIFGRYSGYKAAAGVSSSAGRGEILYNSKTGIALTDAGVFDEFVIGMQLFKQDFVILEKGNASANITIVETGSSKSESNELSFENAKNLSTESIND